MEQISEPETEIAREIRAHAARAFFACAWADWCEHTGQSLSQCEITEVMPQELDPAAFAAADHMIASIEASHSAPISAVFQRAADMSAMAEAGDRSRTAEMFGHYCAMGAMGHGVGLWDALGEAADKFVQTPHMEFSMFDLDPETYPIPESTNE